MAVRSGQKTRHTLTVHQGIETAPRLHIGLPGNRNMGPRSRRGAG